MDEDCQNCPGLCETRETVVHGYGDVAADFCFVSERPTRRADRTGIPFAGVDDFSRLHRALGRLGLCDLTSDPAAPRLENAYVTALTRCRHPDRGPTDDEVGTCESFLDAEIRMINPQLLVPIGQRALSRLGAEYTTRNPDDLHIDDCHAEPIRGRGFELVPMVAPTAATDERLDDWVVAFAEIMASDYRQTKGRRDR
ncbi:uracil-DNA glycosylase [Halovivax cerinus]|uniref:Uracil-DNA glycosylase family protein n=1 Tax=Halovivax cerinus TaxID=1487865 RepID=A0ABD5NML9_9EURY|nr:uracil-DNA glycosylase family protein [Halovivax cerinus]